MRKTFLIAVLACLGSIGFAAAVSADELTIHPEGATPSAPPMSVPMRGMSMADVTKQFGPPTRKHSAVGGASRRQPPIIMWDYEGFRVVFERTMVIDAVIIGQPAPVRRTDELVPASTTLAPGG